MKKIEKTLLITAHMPSSNTQALAKAVLKGAQTHGENLRIKLQTPGETEASHISAADGLILFTTENFGYMSGALKDMFERIYYPLIDTKRGLPYALIVRAGQDGTGAIRSTQSIIQGLGWQSVQAPLLLKGDFSENFTQDAYELGGAFAVGLDEGIF